MTSRQQQQQQHIFLFLWSRSLKPFPVSSVALSVRFSLGLGLDGAFLCSLLSLSV